MEQRRPVIVIADDDEDDRFLLTTAFKECQQGIIVHHTEDGEALMDYLYRRGSHVNSGDEYPPDLIILDLCMPKKDGFEAMKEIKADAELKRIPLLAYTGVCTDEITKRCYDLGANSVIRKPSTYGELAQTAQGIYDYWFNALNC
jgi:CheY-like chemotaxis protein